MRNKIVVCLDSVSKGVFDASSMTFNQNWQNFEKAYSPSTLTLASVSAMFTGELPHRSTSVYQRFVPFHKNIFEMHKERGYNTFLITGIPWLSKHLGLEAGIDVSIDELPKDYKGGHIRKGRVYPLISDMIKMFGEIKKEPYFLWLQVADTHQPYATPDHPDDGNARKFMRASANHLNFLAENGKPMPNWEMFSGRLKQLQIRAVNDMDKYLKIISKENADIVVTADHGEMFNPYYPYGHGFYLLNEEVCRVPLCVRSGNKVGDIGRVISNKDIPDIMLGNPVNQEYAVVEYPFVPSPTKFTDKSSMWVIFDDDRDNLYISVPQSKPFPRDYIKLVDPIIDERFDECLDYMMDANDRYDRVAFASSAGKNSSVMLYIGSKVFDKMDVILADTGQHFPQTIAFLNQMKKRYGFNLHVAKYEGEIDFEIGSVECCAKLKAEPFNALIEDKKFDGVMTAIRRDGNPAWRNELVFSPRKLDSGYEYDRIHPIIEFKENDIWAAIRLWHIPYNPLYKTGMRSIDCQPCSKVDPSSERGGRNPEKEKRMDLLRKVFNYM